MSTQPSSPSAAGDVVVRPGPGVPRGLRIPAGELEERFSRSSGPGGQGVNTTDSRVELLFEPGASAAFTEVQRTRVLAALADRVVQGRIVIVASEHRAQLRNRAAARERLAAMLRTALAPEPPRRRPTKPTRGSQARRLAAKKRRSEIKAGRGRVPRD
ncbi:alternative ribosome rescue aminoacyl-tRNA hydrolase ArfB [Ammonicoccus fulvus]|uniref:Alternative ribosome rescue aminoacyl-tRNA hydrolase ArfB n=1 Tax=Ammonicoccus fulvus TaxID=3138240 RepID=A0ABZ3FST8_9ACTN